MTDKDPSHDSKDNNDWFDLLAGQDAPDAGPVTRREAELVRAAVQAQTDEASELELERGWKAMQTRLEPTGVFKQQRKTAWKPMLVFATAATLAGVLILPRVVWLPTTSKSLPQLVLSNQPQADAQSLATALEEIGAIVTIEKSETGWALSASVPESASPDTVIQALESYDLSLPPGNKVEVIFTPELSQ